MKATKTTTVTVKWTFELTDLEVEQAIKEWVNKHPSCTIDVTLDAYSRAEVNVDEFGGGATVAISETTVTQEEEKEPSW